MPDFFGKEINHHANRRNYAFLNYVLSVTQAKQT